MTTTSVDCPLQCGGQAQRSPIGWRGYAYRCPTCGGSFELSDGAQADADRGQLHPQAIERARQALANGKHPRIETGADDKRTTVIVSGAS
ncbi:hypothetical protein [Cupriavidus pinatubonensis]|uniref:Uncharacterized protein n=1 Tax=Cupriavidus pinatubonensis TaxID=248026 RepID=A0ABN7YC08_9BURK|nr:hypothetical protein [Cupriavidus pinatubonensis]CAG9169741.1 hypothetical protein LMG23994_01640 [Cupriavidus pinatubonensis]